MSMNLDVIFAAVVGVLAAIAVIGALVFVIVWEVCAIRRPGRPSPPYRAARDVLARPRHREHPRAAAMRTVGRWLVAGWLLTALGVLGIDGRLPGFPAWTHRSRCWRSHLLRWYASSVRHRSWTDPQCRNATGWRRRSSATGRGGGRGGTRSRLWTAAGTR